MAELIIESEESSVADVAGAVLGHVVIVPVVLLLLFCHIVVELSGGLQDAQTLGDQEHLVLL